MTGMIERVARAIHFRGEDGGDDAWNHCQSWLRDLAREQAKAAIEAMREPTEMMSRAGMKSIQAWEDSDPDGILMDFRELSCWRTMIDAALGGG
ncbi:MAG: hypothetical protein EOQ34_15630 [Mesorhizobium sp.]|uniref:hypothetical protein n=1 Tax=Mesorhizobium sp. TaxID=1871066 RepID=UPI000FE4E08B|nr:hypothetical protein [Mesorhizobium sp.]RWF71376.1 MAG: hypothetical protein EOQ34_15630 [Mesorhizobium sp.]TIN82212.1 MAG: hypothetical protein E5X97_31155 [Mesorhizobium sp.]TIR63177.1 MAG: hypothetical protein E5X28_02320 [Mesorhizobium sp.]